MLGDGIRMVDAVPVLNCELLPAGRSKSLPVAQSAARPLTRQGLAVIGCGHVAAKEDHDSCLMEQGYLQRLDGGVCA